MALDTSDYIQLLQKYLQKRNPSFFGSTDKDKNQLVGLAIEQLKDDENKQNPVRLINRLVSLIIANEACSETVKNMLNATIGEYATTMHEILNPFSANEDHYNVLSEYSKMIISICNSILEQSIERGLMKYNDREKIQYDRDYLKDKVKNKLDSKLLGQNHKAIEIFVVWHRIKKCIYNHGHHHLLKSKRIAVMEELKTHFITSNDARGMYDYINLFLLNKLMILPSKKTLPVVDSLAELWKINELIESYNTHFVNEHNSWLDRAKGAPVKIEELTSNNLTEVASSVFEEVPEDENPTNAQRMHMKF